MKCKKISALLMASAMVVGLLSGCGSASDSSTSVADDSTAKSSAPAQTEADENITANEVTLPLHTKLSDEDVEFICDTLKGIIQKAAAA